MISDLQLIAQLLIKVHAGDQVLPEEDRRLREIARRGFSSGTTLSDNPPVPGNPDGLTIAEVEYQARLAREVQ